MRIRTNRSARSRGILLAVAAFVATATFVLCVQAAQSTRYFSISFGGTGTTGGLFSSTGGVGDVAVNDPRIADGSGADSRIYVVDPGNNRLQAFDADGVGIDFRWAIGKDVSGLNEQQRLTVDATAGTYTLTFGGDTTAPIAFDATGAQVAAALTLLPSVGAGNVSGSGTAAQPKVLTFGGALAGTDVAQLTVDPAGLSGGAANVLVETLVTGAGGNDVGFEKCTVATACKAGVQGTLGGELGVPTGVDVEQQTGAVLLAERNNNRRLQQFDADGNWKRAFGWDVVQPGGAGETTADLDEQQTVTLTPPGIFTPITGGSFTLSFDPGSGSQVTSAIPFNASAAEVQAALVGLAALDVGDVTVSSPNAGGASAAGGPYTVEFGGALAGTDVAPLTGDASLLVSSGGSSTVVIATTVPGGPGPGFETCTVASQCKSSPAGNQPGQFGSSTNANVRGLAVPPPAAPNAGMAYAADPANCRVLTFQVPTNPLGTVVVGTPFGTCNSGTASASLSDQFVSGYPRDVAAGDDGMVYATNAQGSNAGFVNRYDADEESFLTRINDLGQNGILGSGLIQGLEIDPATGNLLVGRAPAQGIVELDVAGKPEPFDDPGRILDRHFAGSGLSGAFNALGVDPGRGHYYVSSSGTLNGTGTGQRVLVLNDTGVTPVPTIEMFAPQGVSATSATLSASINPNGVTTFPTSYRFQVSKDGIDWVDKTADALVGPAGTGDMSVGVQAAVGDLEPGTDYLARVLTTRASQTGLLASAEVPLRTDPAPPKPVTRPAQQVSDVRAQLTGVLNPGGRETDYWFEWGDDEYGNRVPAVARRTAATGADVEVAETLSGLEPEALYHYRLCATNSLSSTPVCGVDRVFTTRAAATGQGASRGYEMVLSPDKPLRRGGERDRHKIDYSRVQPGWPSPAGTAFNSVLFAGATDEDAGNGYTWAQTYDVRRRPQGGAWFGNAVLNVAPPQSGGSALGTVQGQSADLGTLAFYMELPLFASGSRPAVRMIGDTGGPRAAGWYPWLDPSWFGGPLTANKQWSPLIDDSGKRLVATSTDPESNGDLWRDVTPADGGAAAQALAPPQTAGHAVLRSDAAHDWRPFDLVNECTGVPGGTGVVDTPTALPARVGTGVATDLIGERDCAAGSPTSTLGAMLGSEGTVGRLVGTRAAALSTDGNRIFFVSPDPDPAVGAAAACSTAVAASTQCPPQLFVRAIDGAGKPIVRWISRAEPALRAASQQIGMLGNGVAFEGASRDGRVVYFRTNAVLTTDDPNGGGASPTTGSASPTSWDLYRYALPVGASADPATGTLTRISAGPGAVGNGDLTTGSPIVADVETAEGTFAVGARIAGLGIPASTTITAVGGGTLTLSNAATATGSAVGLSTRTADPNTNCAVADGTCGGSANGNGNSLRFVSDSGLRAYFATAGRIGSAGDPWNQPPAGSSAANVPGTGSTANTSSRNIYFHDASLTGPSAYRFVAKLPATTTGADLDGCASTHGLSGGAPRTISLQGVGGQGGSGSRVNLQSEPYNCVHGSRSGDAIVFETRAQLTADDLDSDFDVYVYDATSHSLTRVSAPPPNTAAYPCVRSPSQDSVPAATCNGDMGFSDGFSRPEREAGTVGAREWNVAQDAGGRMQAVYFESRLPLVEEDRNGDGVMDVYQWRRADGRLTLVSPGETSDSAFYSGNSADGRDVFFWTEQRISPWEIDAADGDIYNATQRQDRPGDPPTPPVVCGALLDSCQGTGDAPVTTPVATGGSGSEDRAPSAARRADVVLGVSAVARRRAARTGILRVRVRSSAPGRVTVRAIGTIRGREATVGRRSRKFGRAGSATVALRLSKAARQRLRGSRALKLDIVARPASGHARTLSVTLRRGGRR